MHSEASTDKESLGDKMAIIQEAAQLYLTDEASYTVHNLAERLEVTPADIYHYYPNKNAVLDGYYTLLTERYRMMVKEIDHFDEYELAEKLSNFIYTTFDMLEEQRAFVEETFHRRVFAKGGEHPFQREVKKLFKQFMKNDPKITSSSQLLMQDLLYDFLVSQYFHLISFWLEDSSAESEKSMAYADKMTSFLQEVMYTSVLDRGFDLFKFIATNDQCFSRIPFIGSIMRKFLN